MKRVCRQHPPLVGWILWSGVSAASMMAVLPHRAFAAPEAVQPDRAKASAQGAPTRTILISIDGLRPDIYLDPDRTGVRVPNLIALRDRGVAAERMVGVFPSVTYPSHTTMVTGVAPARHGITSNFKPGTREWFLETRDIRVEPLWRTYRKASRTTAIVTWPASYGADVDWLVPENLSFGIKDVPGVIARGATPGLMRELTAEAGSFEIPSFEKVDAGEKLDRMTGAYAAAILRRHRPDLMLLHFLDADHQEHKFGPESPEARKAFEQIDALIGALIQTLQSTGQLERTNIVIVGDHGFARVHSDLNVAALLADVAPVLGWQADPAAWPVEVRSDGAGMAFYAKAGASVDAIRLDAELKRAVQRRAAHLARVLSAQELEAIGSYPGALAGLSIIAEGYSLSNRPGDALILPNPGLKGMHGYLPELPMMATGFIAAGPSFRRGYRLPLMRMIDVAPTIAAADRVTFDSADGNAVRGILAEVDAVPSSDDLLSAAPPTKPDR